jgi:hypothetical protein
MPMPIFLFLSLVHSSIHHAFDLTYFPAISQPLMRWGVLLVATGFWILIPLFWCTAEN